MKAKKINENSYNVKQREIQKKIDSLTDQLRHKTIELKELVDLNLHIMSESPEFVNWNMFKEVKDEINQIRYDLNEAKQKLRELI